MSHFRSSCTASRAQVDIILASVGHAKEIAFTFDDAPGDITPHFKPEDRTDALIQKLKNLNVPPVIIFANPCNGNGPAANLVLLQKFKAAGHIIGNHTCTHPNLNKIGKDKFLEDILKSETVIAALMAPKKYFRYPFFSEGDKASIRDPVRSWLTQHDYQNISSSLENEDPIFSNRINAAKEKHLKIDYVKIKQLFLKHILDGVEFYDKLALSTLGRSPKHIILLHDKDATVLFIGELISELRRRGWTIISAAEAAKDPLYSMKPKNLTATYGVLAQVAIDRSGSFKPYYVFSGSSENSTPPWG